MWIKDNYGRLWNSDDFACILVKKFFSIDDPQIYCINAFAKGVSLSEIYSKIEDDHPKLRGLIDLHKDVDENAADKVNCIMAKLFEALDNAELTFDIGKVAKEYDALAGGKTNDKNHRSGEGFDGCI